MRGYSIIRGYAIVDFKDHVNILKYTLTSHRLPFSSCVYVFKVSVLLILDLMIALNVTYHR